MGAAMTTLAELLRHVGSHLLQVSAAPGGLDLQVSDARIYDPQDGAPALPDELVLGAGVAPDAGAAELLRALAEVGAAGLVVRAADALDASVSGLAEEAGIALMRIPTALSWADLLQLVRQALLYAGPEPQHSRFAEEAPGDLSIIAN